MKENVKKRTLHLELRFVLFIRVSNLHRKNHLCFIATKKSNMNKGFVTNTTPALFDESATKFTRDLLSEFIKVNIPTAFLNL